MGAKTMNSSEYNNFTATTDISSHTPEYYMKGMIEELGEFFGHLKRIDRDDNGQISDERWEKMQQEFGDFFWYLIRMWDRLCKVKGVSLITFEEVWNMNRIKLEDRKKRNVIHGEGSHR